MSWAVEVHGGVTGHHANLVYRRADGSPVRLVTVSVDNGGLSYWANNIKRPAFDALAAMSPGWVPGCVHDHLQESHIHPEDPEWVLDQVLLDSGSTTGLMMMGAMAHYLNENEVKP